MFTRMGWRDSGEKIQEELARHIKAIQDIQAFCNHKWSHGTLNIVGLQPVATKTCKGCGLREDGEPVFDTSYIKHIPTKPTKNRSTRKSAKSA